MLIFSSFVKSILIFYLISLVHLFLLFKFLCSVVFKKFSLFYFRNTTVEEFFKYSSNSSTPLSYYYLNSFENLLTSSITLFELTVVNNWFIVMNGYAFVAHSYSRIYFITFYLFTMVVLTIVVASVLQAFRFRIQYKRQISKRDGENLSLFDFLSLTYF